MAAYKNIIESFSEISAKYPDNVAIVFERSVFTYREIDSMSSSYCSLLQEGGISPHERVAVDLDRSVEYVVAILAILKAGCAYVPIERTSPDERMEYIVETAKVRALVGGRGMPLAERVLLLPPPDLNGLRREAPAAFRRPAYSADAEAYVIFTSGSTGFPKGVSVRNRSVTWLIDAARRVFDFSEHDVWSLFHSFSFDFSVWELFGPLMTGGRVVIIPHWVGRNPNAFLNLLAEDGVTVVSQTPTAFQILTAAREKGGKASAPLAIRYVVFGGEVLNPAMLRSWVEGENGGGAKFVNMYGITETTVFVTAKAVDTGALKSDGVVGTALPGWQVHVLDAAMQPLQPGATGEIYVGGVGVADGYTGRPDLTAERFVPDPFSREPGGRLYRSGDFGYLTPTGELAYVGRRDGQVKVRGFRIELNEIETALLGCPSVVAAAVMLDRSAQAPRIVACVVPQRPSISRGDIIKDLQKKVPSYMWPSAICLCESLPVTKNGKLDHAAVDEMLAADRST